MNQNQALEVLIKAVAIGQSKGSFTLAEAKIVAEAVEVFSQKPADVPATPEGEKAPLPAKEDKTDESVPTEATA